MIGNTDDALIWARQRLPALLAEVRSPELLNVLRGRPRYDLRVSFGTDVAIEVWVWTALQDLCRGDIPAVHVPATRAPTPGTPVNVLIDLPNGAGRLRLRAEVVASTPDGFEVRLDALTGEVSLILEALVEAGGGSRDGQWVEGVRRALRARLRGADARVLGLSPSATPKAIQAGYARVQQAWESFLVGGPLADALRPVLVEYGSLLAQVCARLVTPQTTTKQSSGPAGVRLCRPRVAPPTARPAVPKPKAPQPAPVRSATYRVNAPVRAESSTPSQALVQNARRFMTRLGRKARPQPERVESVESVESTSQQPEDDLAKIYALISERSYDAAESELCTKLQADPHQEKLQQLLQLVRARRAATERDFSTAKRIYETLLRRAPGHAAAKKELIMVSALA